MARELLKDVEREQVDGRLRSHRVSKRETNENKLNTLALHGGTNLLRKAKCSVHGDIRLQTLDENEATSVNVEFNAPKNTTTVC